MARRWMTCVAPVVLVACSSDPGLSDELRAEVAAELIGVASVASVTLEGDDALCVADSLDETTATEVARSDEEPSSAALDAVAVGIVDCAGSAAIATTALSPLAGGASTGSLECAGEAFDRDRVVELVRAGLSSQTVSGPAVELEVARVLGQCLTAEELLNLS